MYTSGLAFGQCSLHLNGRKLRSLVPCQVPCGIVLHRRASQHSLDIKCCSKTEFEAPTTQEKVLATEKQSEPELVRASRSEDSRSRRRQADSTDWVASQLTRRFGIAGGLVWLGILTFGVVSEQIKTRLEVSAEQKDTKDVKDQKVVTTATGLQYIDRRIGGGAPVERGFLIVLDYRATSNGKVFEDTMERGKPIVFRYGSRPFTGGLCQGVEEALSTMRAGGIRVVTVPPELGFGDQGTLLRPTEHVPEKQGEVPPGATLEYELNLIRVSIPPS